MIEPITIAIVGCGKAKLAHAAPAADLYTGSLFRAARRYAETCDEWRIISARYGLLDPETVLEPYEQRIHPKERQQFGQVAANRIVSEFLDCGPYELVLLAGEDYARPIADAMRGNPGGAPWRCNCVGVREPLAGLGLGKRLSWFAREGCALPACASPPAAAKGGA